MTRFAAQHADAKGKRIEPRSGGKLIDEAFGEKGGGAVRARPPDARFKSGIGMAMRHLQRRNVIGRDRALDRISIRALVRSEEHTSELQSLMRISYAVFCLKQKKHNNLHNNESQHN